MNTEFVNPFLESIINVLSTMAMTEARPGRPMLKEDNTARGIVTGVIGMTGNLARGSLAITFTEPAILTIAERMLGEKMTAVDEATADVVGEITNMVTGGAKRILSEKGYTFDMSIPTTIIGENHSISHRSSAPVVVVPFETDGGNFFVEICFEE